MNQQSGRYAYLQAVHDYLHRLSEELSHIQRHYDPNRALKAIVYSFSSDHGGDMMNFRARFVVDLHRNQPEQLIKKYGLLPLYTTWRRENSDTIKEKEDIHNLVTLFDGWLRNTPEAEIQSALQGKPLEELADSD